MNYITGSTRESLIVQEMIRRTSPKTVIREMKNPLTREIVSNLASYQKIADLNTTWGNQ